MLYSISLSLPLRCRESCHLGKKYKASVTSGGDVIPEKKWLVLSYTGHFCYLFLLNLFCNLFCLSSLRYLMLLILHEIILKTPDFVAVFLCPLAIWFYSYFLNNYFIFLAYLLSNKIFFILYFDYDFLINLIKFLLKKLLKNQRWPFNGLSQSWRRIRLTLDNLFSHLAIFASLLLGFRKHKCGSMLLIV